jgi:hypothetical protein
MGQERALPPGTRLVFTRYRAWSEQWEHDHCEFCSAKFMDPNYSEVHRRFISEHDDVLTEGYATADEHERGAGYHWVCPPCTSDFAEEFRWRIEGGPAAPTAAS